MRIRRAILINCPTQQIYSHTFEYRLRLSLNIPAFKALPISSPLAIK